MAPAYYPPPAFYFEVTVLGSPKSPWPRTAIDGSFQEISGIERELDVDELREGGENRFTHRLPKRGKHPNLVLKRGLVSESSALANWAEATIGSDFSAPIQPRTLLVTLLSAEHELIVWTFTNAYPVKWVTSSFNANESNIAVETLEMAYATVKRDIKDK
jgi:phage tail-like protein